MTFILTCPHCGCTSYGQIQYDTEPEVLYDCTSDKIAIITGGICHDCGKLVQITEHATIDRIEVEV